MLSIEELIKNKPELVNLLMSMPIEVRNRCEVKRFSPKSIVVKKDEDAQHVYIICSGTLRVMNEFENGKLFGIAYKNSMDFVGVLEALADETKIACTVEAITECIALRISKKDFLGWVQSDHFFCINIAKLLAKNFYPTAYNNGEVIVNSARYSVVSFIVRSINNDMQEDKAAIINTKRQLIADELGISLRTVHRVIKELKAEGMLNVVKGKIFVNKDQRVRLLNALKELSNVNRGLDLNRANKHS